MGREEGIQQPFRKNGELYANYEAIIMKRKKVEFLG